MVTPILPADLPWKPQKSCVISTVDQAEAIELKVAESAHQVLRSFQSGATAEESLSMLWALKAGSSGLDPIDITRPLNFIEQLNQSFTYLATARAAKWLLEHHPEHGPFSVNLGTSSGPDIACKADPKRLHGEVFAAANVTNNRKLTRDIAYLKKFGASMQYAFFMAPAHEDGRRQDLEAKFASDGVRIVALSSQFFSVTTARLRP